jgi:hypothetical protein
VLLVVAILFGLRPARDPSSRALLGVTLPAPGHGGKDQIKPPADKRESALFGVVTVFAVTPAKIRHSDEVQITLKMTNMTPKPVQFRYSACIEQHVELFDSDGNKVYWKNGAPIPECPYLEVEIQPAATIERTASFAFGRYYAVADGIYEIGFKYDQRLMSAAEPKKDPWLSWGRARLKLEVKE